MPRVFQYIVDAVRRPREQLSRGQHFVRYSRDLAVHCYRQLERHRAEGMAAELTYRTIFALIPVVVLGLVMFRVFGGLDDVQTKVENQLFSFFGVPEITEGYLDTEVPVSSGPGPEPDVTFSPRAAELPGFPLPEESEPAIDSSRGDLEAAAVPPEIAPSQRSGDGPGSEPRSDAVVATDEAVSIANEISRAEAAGEAEAMQTARANIRRTLSEVTDKVASIDFASIGVIGLLLFIYAAVALADSTEHLFNRIYEAPTQRPIHIRVAIHWSIITLGSGLLAMSLYMSGQVIDWFGEIGAGSTLKGILSHLVAMAASWVLLFLLYALMPNTHVSVRAAAISALIAALLWESAKYGFQIYVTKAVPYSAIYGSIGLIPLFLFWIYVTWLIVLFGLILTYTLQTLRGSRVVRSDVDPADRLIGDPDWMLPIMTEVARAFAAGEAIDNQELADRLGLTSRVTHEMVGKLVDDDLLRRVTAGAGEKDSLTLARPAEGIEVGEILAIAHRSRPTSDHPSWQALSELKKAERQAAAGVRLVDLL
jgi:membrane protein